MVVGQLTSSEEACSCAGSRRRSRPTPACADHRIVGALAVGNHHVDPRDGRRSGGRVDVFGLVDHDTRSGERVRSRYMSFPAEHISLGIPEPLLRAKNWHVRSTGSREVLHPPPFLGRSRVMGVRCYGLPGGHRPARDFLLERRVPWRQAAPAGNTTERGPPNDATGGPGRRRSRGRTSRSVEESFPE